MNDYSGKSATLSKCPAVKIALIVGILLFCVIIVFLSAIGYLQPHFIGKHNRVSAGRPMPVSDEASLGEVIDQLIEKHSSQTNADGKADYVVSYQDDVNCDGTPDTIVGTGDRLTIVVSDKGENCIGRGYSDITSVGFDDVDGDGRRDAWCCDSADGFIEIFWGNGKGDFTTRQTLRTGSHFGIQTAFYDMNGDGILDLVMSSFVGPEEYFWIPIQKIERQGSQNGV